MIIGRFFFSENGENLIEASRIWTFLLVTPALEVRRHRVRLDRCAAAVILISYGMVAGQQNVQPVRTVQRARR